ncbi:hypothetical protein [Smaragdicoccus niigatensis]|uniref:hypothetical protein n=1 Tax=Smaragdicoccus niigatensis TaxID=359359 RepID=UPI000374960F|nr:hypothetical protein [Smaragdicoccus niigatensis]
MSIITVNELSTFFDRAVQRSSIADNKVTRSIAVLATLGFSGLVGIFATLTLLFLISGVFTGVLTSLVLAFLAAAPALYAFKWLDQIQDEELLFSGF